MTLPAREGRALSWRLEPDGPRRGLLEVELHREPLNELGPDALEDLEALAALLADDAARGAVRGVLLASRLERGFCAGADLRALHTGLAARTPEAGLAEARDFVTRINEALTALDQHPAPTCAAVHGVCFGGGFELALCCDLLVADRTARFAFPELRLGLLPGFGGLVRLERETGNARVRDLLLTGRSLRAEAAQAWGLVSQVAAPGRARDVARRTLLQAMRQDAAAVAALKERFKPARREALRAEVDAFCRLLDRPPVRRALERFVARADPLPYVAQGGAGGPEAPSRTRAEPSE